MDVFRTNYKIFAFVFVFYAGFAFAFLQGIFSAPFERQPLMLRLIMDFLLAAAAAFMLFLAILYSGEDRFQPYMLFAFALGEVCCRYGIVSLCKKLFHCCTDKRKNTNCGE